MHEETGADGADESFGTATIDLDEWRDTPVRHRYVHGAFARNETRFSIYLPPAERYEGRFFQHITPIPDSENLAQEAVGEEDKIGFAIASGAYFLETNGGGVSGTPGSSVDPTIAAYRANAAAARYSRLVAAQMYGDHRPFGYAYGGSGGGYRTIGGAENTSGVWDGVVPYVIGSPMSIPNMFTVRMHAQRILRHQFDRVIDSLEPGGSGDMFEGLDVEEREALLEVTRMGFPPRSWFGYRTMGMHAFPLLYGGLLQADPAYFEDFWTKPGYLGFDPPPSLQRDRVVHSCNIAETITKDGAEALGLSMDSLPGQVRSGVDVSWRGSGDPQPVPVAVRLTIPLVGDVLGADLFVTSGAASGARLTLISVEGDIARFGPSDTKALVQLAAGDAVQVDNRGFLAAQTYHRHQVPETADYPVWDQFRNDDGSPTYPQRPLILGPLFAAAAAGMVQTGRFEGKMIVVESLLDREALPWQADWYRSRVKEHFGSATDEHFRLWFTANALHGDSERQESPTYTVSYLGMLHQALRDLSRWVEKGIAPAPNTAYEIVDGQVIVPDDAPRRHGLQPVVNLTIDGKVRADITTGSELIFQVSAEVPDGTGSIVSVEWDFDGSGQFSFAESPDVRPQVMMQHRHTFKDVGTYFPTVRVVAHREGDPHSPYARIGNLARVRVVVAGR